MVGVRSTIHQVLRARGYDPIALDPWYFPTPKAYRTLLEEAGFIVQSCRESSSPLDPQRLIPWATHRARTSYYSTTDRSRRLVSDIRDIFPLPSF